MKTLEILCLLVVAAFSTHTLEGKVFVVDKRAKQASDRNPGTVKKPLKTISAAVSKVRAGDQVIIHGGEYRETVIITATGTKEAPIIIESAPGETVVIKGSDIVTGWTKDRDAIWKAQLPKLPPRSTNSNDTSFWMAKEIYRVFIRDGVLLDAIHLGKVKTKDGLRPGSFFHDTANSSLYAWLPESGDPNQFKVEVAVRAAWLNLIGSYISVRGIQMRHASALAVTRSPTSCSIYGEGSRLENCVMSWGDFGGVAVGGNRNSLVRCVIACNGNSGIAGTGEGHLIEGCQVIYNNIDRFDPSWHCGGAKLIPKFNKGRIIGNEFAYNIGPGLWLDESCNENRLEQNFCHDNEGPGIMVEVSVGNVVLNNISFANRNPVAGEFLIPAPTEGTPGEPNRFITRPLNDRRVSTLLYQGGGGLGIFISSSPNSRVYNNTCYLNEGGGITVEGPLRNDMSTRGCSVRNNISVYNKGPQLIIRKNGMDADTSGNSSDYNLLLALGSILAKHGWSAEVAFTLSEWQRVSKHDAHSQEGDPHFVMPTMGDFRLLDESPALGAGQVLPDVKNDFFGQPRPDGQISIGAAEKSTLAYPRPPWW